MTCTPCLSIVYFSCVQKWWVQLRLKWCPHLYHLKIEYALYYALRGNLWLVSKWLCSEWICLCIYKPHTDVLHCASVTVAVSVTGSLPLSTVPSYSPLQRIVCKLWSSVIGKGPLMCPWAFSAQTESHRRAHTDNRAARHGFRKVTLRIAFNA